METAKTRRQTNRNREDSKGMRKEGDKVGGKERGKQEERKRERIRKRKGGGRRASRYGGSCKAVRLSDWKRNRKVTQKNIGLLQGN